MKVTLQELLVDCVQAGRTGGAGVDPYKYPSQVGLHGLKTSRNLTVLRA